MLSMLTPQGRAASAEDLRTVAAATEQRLGPLAHSMFRFGDQLQRNTVDLAFSLMNPANLAQTMERGATAAREMAQGGLAVARQAGAAVTGQGAAPAPDAGAGWGPMS